MSVKTDRIAHSMIREISYILENEIKDPNIKFVTVTDVHVTNDLSFAKVYVTVLNEEKIKDTMKSLKNASSYIRKVLAERIDVRHIPELQFAYDESIEYGKNIEEKLKEIHKKEN